MTLTPEQQQAVAGWAAAGDNLSAIQRKLTAEFKISITYMDLRFLLDDLKVQLKDAAPKPEADLSKAPAGRAAPADPRTPPAPEKKGFLDKAKQKLGLAKEETAAEAAPDDPLDEDLPPEAVDEGLSAGPVSVAVDKITVIPGALASGTMAFGASATGKWIVDNYGRPGITEISPPDYRPSPADAQAFMQELSRVLQQRGL